MERVYEVTIDITVNDPSVISRCVNNEDGWREMFYDLETEDDVLNHLAYNFVVNGIHQINRLDGWADLPADVVAFHLTSFESGF